MYASRRPEWEHSRERRGGLLLWHLMTLPPPPPPCCSQDRFVFKMPGKPTHPSYTHALAEWASRREAFAQRPSSAPNLMVPGELTHAGLVPGKAARGTSGLQWETFPSRLGVGTASGPHP